MCEVTAALRYKASHPGLHTKQNKNNPMNKQKIVMRIWTHDYSGLRTEVGRWLVRATLPTVGAERCLERTGPADFEKLRVACAVGFGIFVEVHVGSSWYELRLGIRIFVQFPMGFQCCVKIKVTVSLMGTFLCYWQENNPREESPILADIQYEYSWDERKFYSGLFILWSLEVDVALIVLLEILQTWSAM